MFKHHSTNAMGFKWGGHRGGGRILNGGPCPRPDPPLEPPLLTYTKPACLAPAGNMAQTHWCTNTSFLFKIDAIVHYITRTTKAKKNKIDLYAEQKQSQVSCFCATCKRSINEAKTRRRDMHKALQISQHEDELTDWRWDADEFRQTDGRTDISTQLG